MLHIDIHIGNLSIIKRLPEGVKISRDAKGNLTQASKDKIMEIVSTEFKNRARLAQNLDHSYDDAKFQWKSRNAGPTGYGAGEYRLIVDDSPIYMYSGEHALHISAPHVVNNKLLYVYRLGTTEKNKVPILSIGVKDHDSPALPDKLHLHLVTEEEEFLNKVGIDGDIRVKYDGACTTISITKHGVAAFSPRTSKKDGKRIEYNAKIPGLEKTHAVDKSSLVMGELLYKNKKGEYLKAHEVGGILNGGSLNAGVKPEIRIYRVIKLNGKDYAWVNQDNHIQDIKDICKLNPTLFKVPEKVPVDRMSSMKDVEGFVGIPTNGHIEDGYKYKMREEYQDGIITDITFRKNGNGNIEGVLYYRDDKTGRTFKTASGFSDKLKIALSKNKKEIIGQTIELKGFKGYSARGVTFKGFHLDKGFTLPKPVQCALTDDN